MIAGLPNNQINLTWEPAGFHPEIGWREEHVVMEGRYTGTYKASGKSLDARVCHVLRFQDGKLVRFQQYVDTGQMQAVMATR